MSRILVSNRHMITETIRQTNLSITLPKFLNGRKKRVLL
jgi:hypothetical protein